MISLRFSVGMEDLTSSLPDMYSVGVARLETSAGEGCYVTINVRTYTATAAVKGPIAPPKFF